MNLRPSGMTIVQQQGMNVLGVNLSTSVNFKDRYAVRPRVMLNVSQNRPNYKSSSVETIDKQSSFQTWAHIIPVVNWNHEALQTNSQQTKIVIVQHKHNECYIVIHCRRSGTTSELLSYYNTSSK